MSSALISNNKPHNLGVLCNISNLEAYINTVMRLPMLTHEQEIALGKRWRDHKDEAAADELVLSHLKLVVTIARDYLGYHLPHADLIQEGNIGLMKAARKFDPDFGFRFTSYAIQWIKAEIREYVIRNCRMVRFATTKAHRKLFYNLRGMRSSYKTMTPAEVDEVASKLNVPRQDVIDMEARLYGTEFTLDAPTTLNNGEEVDSNDAILGTSNTEPTEMIAASEWHAFMSTGITDALDELNPRERRIIEARWMLDDGPTPLKTLAEELGVSTQRVNQIEKAAIKKLSTVMQDYREFEPA